MNNKVVIDEDIWGLIINLCFRLNELKHISVDEPSPQTLLFAYVYNNVKDGLDATLGALGLKGMLKEVEKTKDFTQNTMTIFRMGANGLGNKTEFMALLDKILADVTKLEELLSLYLKQKL
tara:strand:+ start:1077 stop:1439 length:363 start_codon:yes stop_codon:yes gene_type:complete